MADDYKKILKEKMKKAREESRVFRSREKQLNAKKYRYSLRYENTTVQDNGKAYINVDLTKVDTPFSVFSYNRRINQEIYDFIDNEVFYLRASIPVVINFDDGGEYSEEMRDKITKAVIRHYSLAYEDKRIEYSKSITFASIILSIGVLILLAYIIISLTLLKNSNIYIEIIAILSWVFCWEAVDRFLFSGHERRVDVNNAAQLALAEVQFGKPVIKK